VGWAVGSDAAGTVEVEINSTVVIDVICCEGLVVVGEEEVGDVVTTVVRIAVGGVGVLPGVTFCGVTVVDWVATAVVGAGVTCTVFCTIGEPDCRSVPEPDISTLLSLPWSARA
jgi:hypothetical protein